MQTPNLEARWPFEVKNKEISKPKGLGYVFIPRCRKCVIPFPVAWHLGIDPSRVFPCVDRGHQHRAMLQGGRSVRGVCLGIECLVLQRASQVHGFKPQFSVLIGTSRKDSSTSLADLFLLLSRFLTQCKFFLPSK